MEQNTIEKAPDRIEVLKKIEELERQGHFDIDAEADPPTIELKPDMVDYLQKKKSTRIKRKVAYNAAKRFLDSIIKNNQLIIKDVVGLENLKSVSTGAIITCNHFNPFDCFTVEKIFRDAKLDKIKRLYKVIREGNYTNFPGFYGFLFKYCDTLPLSSNKKTMINFMHAVDEILRRGDFVLIYPEQSLWWNYRKPKPLKEGAFKMAVKSEVPVIPIFITMQDSDIIADNGFPVQEYYVHIEKPIYPDLEKTRNECVEEMKTKNYAYWKNIYENFYNKKLEYNTEN